MPNPCVCIDGTTQLHASGKLTSSPQAQASVWFKQSSVICINVSVWCRHVHKTTTQSTTGDFRLNMHVSIHKVPGRHHCSGIVAGLRGAAVVAVHLLGRQATLCTLGASLRPH